MGKRGGLLGLIEDAGDVAGDVLTSVIKDPSESLFNLVGGGSLETNRSREDRATRERSAAITKRRKDLLDLVKTDESISAATKKELSESILGASGSFRTTQAELEGVETRFKEAQKAKEGSVFASRQGTEELLSILKDKPGRSQFVSSGRSKNSLLGG